MKKIFLLAIIYIACFANAKAFPPDSCLQVVPNISGSISNPDSLMWDTCTTIKDYRNLFGKSEYSVVFKYNIIPRNYITVIDSVNIYTLTNILPQYSWIKDSLITLSSTLGTFTILDRYMITPDTTLTNSRVLYLKFNQIHNLKNCADSILKLSFVDEVISKSLKILNKINNSEINIENLLIEPNPVNNEILISYQGENPPTELAILDEKGRVYLQTKFNNRIDVSFLPSGIYFMKVNNQICKFIKSN